MKKSSEDLDELVRLGAEIREQISLSATRLNDVYRGLYEKLRRQPSEDDTSAYLLLANMGQRFAAVIAQGEKRVRPLEKRVIGLTEQRKRDIAEEEVRLLLQLRKEKDKQKELQKTIALNLSDDDFLALYGEDFE